VALLVAEVWVLVPLLFEVLLLEPTALDAELLDSDVLEVPPAADVDPSLASELQPRFAPARAKSAAPTTRPGASAR